MNCITCVALQQEAVSDVHTIRVGKYEVGVCDEHKELYAPLPEYKIEVRKLGDTNIVSITEE